MRSEETLKKMTLHERERYLKHECDSLQDAYTRLNADFINFKRNKELEIEKLKATASKDAVLAFIGFYDVLRIAMIYEPKNESLNDLMDSLLNCLSHAGVEMYGEVGDLFDSDLHEAYSIAEVDGVENGHISIVMKKGCKLNGEIIRYAVVSVA